MPPSAHEFALLDQEFSNGEAFLARPQPGYETCRYLFFPGCQAAAVSPRTVEITYRRLREELEGGTGLLLGCCGAISRWAAREELLQEALEKIRAAWESMGRPEILCACPTCLKKSPGADQPAGAWGLGGPAGAGNRAGDGSEGQHP